ncbi:MAG: restriction endonuclease subunit S, partial [Bacteroidales bacterium]
MKKSYPEHWVETTLKEVVVSKKGKKPKILKDKPFPKSSPYIDIEAFETGLIKQYADNESSNICVPTDVLVVWDGARFGLAGFGQSGSIGSTLACLTPIIVEPRYLYKFIQSHYSTIQQKPKGMATPHVDPDLFWNLELPLPPLNEQKRIAEKLDAILPKVKSARDRLEKIPAILKKFRQSVLAAACSGKLTEDWREGKNFNLHEYLEVIINERKKDKKYSKYLNTIIELKLPIEWSLENDVPESWLITKMGIICPKITDGTHDTPKRLKKGIPYITGKHIRDRYIDFNNCDYITIEEHKKIYARCNPEYDDVLMVNIGAGTATPARVNVTYEFSMKNVALLKVDNKLITGRYLEYHQLRFKDYIFNQITKGGA